MSSLHPALGIAAVQPLNPEPKPSFNFKVDKLYARTRADIAAGLLLNCAELFGVNSIYNMS
jgi:hypothetical protein